MRFFFVRATYSMMIYVYDSEINQPNFIFTFTFVSCKASLYKSSLLYNEMKINEKKMRFHVVANDRFQYALHKDDLLAPTTTRHPHCCHPLARHIARRKSLVAP